jgi:hypothetical protein
LLPIIGRNWHGVIRYFNSFGFWDTDSKWVLKFYGLKSPCGTLQTSTVTFPGSVSYSIFFPTTNLEPLASLSGTQGAFWA